MRRPARVHTRRHGAFRGDPDARGVLHLPARAGVGSVWQKSEFSPSTSRGSPRAEERILDENLLSLGRRSAAERTAYYLLHLYVRADDIGLVTEGRVRFPFHPAASCRRYRSLLGAHQQDAEAAGAARPHPLGSWLVFLRPTLGRSPSLRTSTSRRRGGAPCCEPASLAFPRLGVYRLGSDLRSA